MCGIFCTICRSTSSSSKIYLEPCHDNLKRRGPNASGSITQKLSDSVEGVFFASVLWMQGCSSPTKQPLVDAEGNILLWNGDILDGTLRNEGKCDSLILLTRLQTNDVLNTLAAIQGPYSFIYLDRKKMKLWFGRDPVGKHSFLFNISEDAAVFTSVGVSSIPSLQELPAAGIFKLDLSLGDFTKGLVIHPWEHRKFDISRMMDQLNVYTVDVPVTHCILREFSFQFNFDEVGHNFDFLSDPSVSGEDCFKLFYQSSRFAGNVEKLLALLRRSVQVRIGLQPPLCAGCIETETNCAHSKTAVLFSGGLDSTVLALLCHEFVPESEPIDLFNVAFEKISRPQNVKQKNKFDSTSSVEEPKPSESNFKVPDRISGLNSFEELEKLCPGRKWNFVEINVSREELNKFRKTRISDLIYPLDTILDDSLGCALWFAASGRGLLDGESYCSPARVLILGMGADELLGGYTRHRKTFERSGWEALNKELLTEVWNISLRNLGRDNRVTSDHGRQPRFPFLDENVIAFLTQLPPWDRCWFPNTKPGVGDKLLLRLLAWKLGLQFSALLPKRALQFGSRIADSKEKGNIKCQRLTT